mmetsp:Transcript_23242/g.62299  ORF Transcript_23242/g.62299 Transcript_23242/m.62299 type:complete len:115 (+) Transcript_23242:95-439(+)
MSGLNVPEVVNPMRAQFDSGRTRSYTWRVEALKQAKKMVTERSDQLAAALASDLGKTTEEATITEMSVVLHEIDEALANLKVGRPPLPLPPLPLPPPPSPPPPPPPPPFASGVQ